MPNSTKTGKNGFSRQPLRWPYLILLLLLVAGSYSNTLHSPFVLDDFHSFLDSPAVTADDISPASLKELSSTVFGKSRLIPIITFAVDHVIGGGSVVQYHITNIAVHLLCTVMIFFFIRAALLAEAGKPARRYFSAAGFSLTATALWALNPVQTNAVTYLVQRMTSIATLFYVSALVLYVYARMTGSRRQRCILLSAAAITAILAFMSKQNTFTLPAAILLVECYFLFPGGLVGMVRSVRKRYWIMVSLLAMLVLPLFLPYLGHLLDGYGHRDFTLAQRLLTELRVVVLYISLLLAPLPGRLNLEHDLPLSITLLSPPTTLFSLVVLIALLVVGVKTRKSHPLISFGIMWFFLHQVIESTVIPLEIIFEHRLYLPSIGFFLVIVSLVDLAAGSIGSRFHGRNIQRLLIFAVVFVVSLSSILTFHRNKDWSDALTFYTDCVEKSPNKARPNNNLGIVYAEAGNYENAISQYQIALRLDPEYFEAYNNLGLAYTATGLYDKAIENFQQALKLRPDMVEAWNNLGLVYSRKGMVDKAFEAYRQALELDPVDPGIYNNFGDLYAQTGNLDSAVDEYGKASRIRPDFAETYNKLGIIYGKKGLADESLKQFSRALQLDPENSGYHNNIANAYMMKGLVSKAKEHRKQAAALQGKK